MDKYEETFETWDKMADLYQDKFMHLDLYNETYDFICHSLTEKQTKILEIGCGPGNIAKYLLAQRPDFSLLGIDIAPNMIKLAQKNNPKAIFAVMDSRQIDKLDIRYDAIVCGFCLPYLSREDCIKFIKDCQQLLLAEGLLYLSFVEGEPEQSDFKTGSHGNRVFFYFHSLAHISQQLADCQFEILKIYHLEYKKGEAVADIHTVLIAKKKAI